MYCDLASKGGVVIAVCLFALGAASSRCCKMFGYALAKPEMARHNIEVVFILKDREVAMLDEETF